MSRDVEKYRGIVGYEKAQRNEEAAGEEQGKSREEDVAEYEKVLALFTTLYLSRNTDQELIVEEIRSRNRD